MIVASVIIPIKNGGELFKKVVDKVLSQEVEFPYELILVDSGSSDGTLEFAQSVAEREDNVRLYKIKPEDFGHGKTRNYAASFAAGDFFVFLTQDALPYDETWLQKLVSAFKNDPEIGGVFGKHLPYENALPVEKHTIINHFDKYIGDTWQKIKITDIEHFKLHTGWYIFFSNNNSAIRKSLFKELKFSEVEMSEDQNFAKEMLLKGYAKAYAHDAIVYHSHRYTMKEILKRFFDEYRSYNLLGVTKESTILAMFKFYIKQYASSVKAIYEVEPSLVKKCYWVIYFVFYDAAKALGYYFGTNAQRFNFYNTLSMQEENKRK